MIEPDELIELMLSRLDYAAGLLGHAPESDTHPPEMIGEDYYTYAREGEPNPTPSPAPPEGGGHLSGVDLEDHATAAGFRNFDQYAHHHFGFGAVARAAGVPAGMDPFMHRGTARDLANVSEYRGRLNGRIAAKLRAGQPLPPEEQSVFESVHRLASRHALPVGAVAYRVAGGGLPELKPGDVYRDPAPTFVGFRESDVNNIAIRGRRQKFAIHADPGARMLYVNGGEPWLEALLPANAPLEITGREGDTLHARYRAPLAETLPEDYDTYARPAAPLIYADPVIEAMLAKRGRPG